MAKDEERYQILDLCIPVSYCNEHWRTYHSISGNTWASSIYPSVPFCHQCYLLQLPPRLFSSSLCVRAQIKQPATLLAAVRLEAFVMVTSLTSTLKYHLCYQLGTAKAAPFTVRWLQNKPKPLLSCPWVCLPREPSFLQRGSES